jgi:hypothetical protein
MINLPRIARFSALISLLFIQCSHAQIPLSIKRTANDFVPVYAGDFGFGSNMGYYPPHNDEQIADFAAAIGVKTMRPALFEHFLETWGYDVRVAAFKHYEALGMKDNVCFLGYPSPEHRENKIYCGKDSSAMFANMYEPIWDKGENGTPVNDKNYYALYVYKTVKTYGKWVKFWEIWNEPDYATTFKTEMAPGLPGAWWNTNPDPCEYALHAPIQHYIRMLRISYEVIKSLDPTAYVALGGIGFPSFLDVLLRQSDNPNGGSKTPQYPLNGGAYFDVVSYHVYPHIDNSVREWSDKINGFQHFRHSDRAVQGIFKKKKNFEDVLNKYGYNGRTFPKKEFIITESNIPAKEKGEFMGSYEAQRNFLLKALVKSQVHNLLQFHTYSIGEIVAEDKMTNEFDLMGMYYPLTNTPVKDCRPTPQGIANKSISTLLSGYRYDSMETKRLNLPADIDGAAFRQKSDNATVYCLWAKTRMDRSEAASANYSFPDLFCMTQMQRMDWQFSTTNDVQILNAKQIPLTSSPCFFKKGQAELVKMTERDRLFCFQNPVKKEVVVNFRIDKNTAIASLKLADAKNKKIAEAFDNQTFASGIHQFKLNTEGAASGTYTVQLIVGGQLVTQKITLKK